MNYSFGGPDYGIFVFGRKVLAVDKSAHITFKLDPKSFHVQELYWDKGIEQIAKATRFGRIGIVYERKNILAPLFVYKICSEGIIYTPKEKQSEKTLSVKPYETQILWELANEGLADTVEFRRLARKYIRKAKNEHRDSLFFLDAILGENKTRKILHHIAGTQIKLYFPSDFLEIDTTQSHEKRSLEIKTQESKEFTHHRAEQILQTKIADEDVKELDD